MKQIIKKIFKVLFGVDENILFHLNCSFLTTAILFFILATITTTTNTKSVDTFTFISGVCFAIWIILIQGSDSAMNFVSEVMRLIFFFIVFLYSLQTCLQFSLDNNSTSTFNVVFSSFGLFLCTFYIISKMTTIFNLIKKLFHQFKIKLFNSDKPAATKVKALIENVTAFLVSIGALTIAIKTITESIIQTLEYFK